MSKQSTSPFHINSPKRPLLVDFQVTSPKVKRPLLKKSKKPKTKKGRTSLNPKISSPTDFYQTLVLIEREYIKTLINIKSPVPSTKNFNSDETLKKIPCGNIKFIKHKTNNSEHTRKSSLAKKNQSNCSSPGSDKSTKIISY